MAFALTFLSTVSCNKDKTTQCGPVVPQGEVTREFLSRIRVGKDGNFQYWNQDSPALKELKAFVATVTDPNCKGYVPPQDRVATFDVDGTLMCETAPFYFNWMLFFHRYLHDSTFTPPEEDRRWAAEVEEYVLANRKNKKEWGLKQQELQAIGFRGMTDVQFSEYVRDFINNENVTGLSDLKWGTALYWPMIEAVSYLIANDFVVFLCSGVDCDVCRVISEGIYDIPKYHMIASDVNYVLENQPEWIEMVSSEDYVYTPGEEVQRGDFMQLTCPGAIPAGITPCSTTPTGTTSIPTSPSASFVMIRSVSSAMKKKLKNARPTVCRTDGFRYRCMMSGGRYTGHRSNGNETHNGYPKFLSSWNFSQNVSFCIRYRCLF